MSAARRHLPRCVAASVCLAALPLLAGCMSLDSSTTIVNDQEIHTLVDVGISNDVANTYGLDAHTICGPFTAALPGGAVASPYIGNDGVHCRITATSTLAQMQAAPGSAMSITHSGHEYRFSFSPNEASLGGVSLPGLTTGVDAVRVQVTFPGRVTSASSDAHVQNHTVTWDQQTDITQALTASGLDRVSHGHGLLRWLLAASSLLLALIAAAVLLHDRRRRASASPTTPPSTTPPSTTPPPDNAPGAHEAGSGTTPHPTVAAPTAPAPGGGDAGSPSTGSHASRSPAWTSGSWAPASDASAPPPTAVPGDHVPHETAPRATTPEAPVPGARIPEETGQPDQPTIPVQPPMIPAPPADPWGGRSPWQRPE